MNLSVGPAIQPPRRAQQRRLRHQHVRPRRRDRQLRAAIALVGDENVDRRAQADGIFGTHALQREVGGGKTIDVCAQPCLRRTQRRPGRIDAADGFALRRVGLKAFGAVGRLGLADARGHEAAGQQRPRP
ncbi:hypothetical protein WR25_27337 [Diploscapter pachys]|uniref:Uncharacterized protein n=1 Tax=Diploscapter pachys TaxID=2018661 RepID=A0A2A2KHT1_9BILA|nr:hypothetical protein WR25_27337 [Diploscapter pachys]